MPQLLMMDPMRGISVRLLGTGGRSAARIRDESGKQKDDDSETHHGDRAENREHH
jgi:hypothetical protein